MTTVQFITLHATSLLCIIALFVALKMIAKFKDELKARLVFLRVLFGYNFLATITLGGSNWLWLKTSAFVLLLIVLVVTLLYEWKKIGAIR